MSDSDIRKGIYRGYQQAGANFLAYRLGKIFTKIETPEDIALHNDVLAEVLQIIYTEEKSFFRTIAEQILYTPFNRRKRFVWRVACTVLNIGTARGPKKGK